MQVEPSAHPSAHEADRLRVAFFSIVPGPECGYAALMNLDSVIAAQARISPYIHRTPVLTSHRLDEQTQAKLFFKAENLQKVGAFKARGAVNAVLSLDSDTLARGAATHSSGTHGAALAYAARIVGTTAHVVMPDDSLPNKIAAVRGYGAKLTLCTPTLADREAACDRIVRETGATVIHPYDDDRIIAGQGTAALEFLSQTDNLDILIAPVGGGGLLAGTVLVAKKSNISVIAAEPAMADDAYRSWQARKRIPPERTATIADGLRTGLGERNFAIIQNHLEAVQLVTEEAIIHATQHLMHTLKTVIEPSAAVPMAAILEHPGTFAGKRVGIILSGGNLDLSAPPWLTRQG